MASISIPRHTYLPLPSSHIRILVLEPSLDTLAPLRFSFHSANLNDVQGEYEAVSYTWGEPNLVFPLHHADGSQIFVTENLDRALRRLRHRLDQRLLWADAVCINQHDDREKEVQIPLMGRIYRGAKRVLAWLGPGGGQDEEGMRLLEGSSQSLKHPKDCTSEELMRMATCIDRFFDLSWFRRLWIVQECVLNVDLSLICGQSKISLARLLAGLQVILDESFWVSVPYASEQVLKNPGLNAIQKTTRVWLANSRMGSGDFREPAFPDEFDILHLVDTFGNHGCVDDRDRIFALYGLASNVVPRSQKASNPAVKVHMNVDYSLNVQETYRTFATACVANDMTSRIINACLARQHHPISADWPSWVPDWRLQPSPNTALPRALSGFTYPNMPNPERSPTALPYVVAGEISRNKLQLRVRRSVKNSRGSRSRKVGRLANSIRTSSSEQDRAPSEYIIRVKTIFAVGMPSSTNDLLRSIVNMYKTKTFPSAPWQGASDHLFNILQNIWALPDSDRKPFKLWLERLWSAPQSDFIDEDMSLSSRIAAVMEDRCLFTITFVSKSEGRRHTSESDQYIQKNLDFIGFGSSSLRPGDILIEMVSNGRRGGFETLWGSTKLYTSLAFRPVVAEQGPNAAIDECPNEVSWDVSYRLVGEALVYVNTDLQPELYGDERDVVKILIE